MAKKKIKFMCTAFRDGFQSVYGARVLSKDYLPVVKQAKEAGLTYFESGGGALFQSPFFYARENAFDVMDAFRQTVGEDVTLQTLARGVNVVGLDSQPRDIINLHAKLFKKHGVDVIRNFDALNDPDNLAYSGQCIVDAGLKHQLCIAIMSLPPGCEGAHTPDFYEMTLKKFLEKKIPFDSLCFKDASGTTVPAVVYESIRRAKALLGEDFPIQFHSHETAGVSVACYLSAIEAGAQTVDLSLAPVSGGTCSPDVATFWHALRGSNYELDVDVDAVMKVEEAFKEAMKDYFLPPEALRVDPRLPWSPMPGGALTANTQMLRDNGLMDKFSDIIKAMEEVVRKGGFGTSVTPVSQFYFQQAFNNVVFGPWQQIDKGYGKMVLGYFGKTPIRPDEEVVRIASEKLGLAPTELTPLQINDDDPAKGIAPATEKLKAAKLPITDENVFIAATCGDKGIAFLKGTGPLSIRYKEKPASLPADGQVKINGEVFHVSLENGKAFVNGKEYRVQFDDEAAHDKASSVSKAAGAGQAGAGTGVSASSGSSENGTEGQAGQNASSASNSGDTFEIKAPTAGTILKVEVKEGQRVTLDTTLFLIEVMKMEVAIKAPKEGVITSVEAQPSQSVQSGQVLALMR